MNQQLLSRLTLVLIGACVLFGLLALAFGLGLGRGFSWLPPDPGKAPRLPAVSTLQSQPVTMPAFATFAEIIERPLFSDTRKPIAPDDSADADAKPAPPPVPLQVTLTGVIITPTVKLAMLHNKATNKSVSLREGMPLSGNQAAWTLVKIEPRKVTFSDDSAQEMELALDVSAQSVAPGGHVPRVVNPAQRASQQQQATSNSLRERIEKRRAELRQRAEEVRARQQESGENDRAHGSPSAVLPRPQHHGKTN